MSNKSNNAVKQAAEASVKNELSTQINAELPHGFEEITNDSLTIPFLNIVQDLTPLYKQQENRPDGIRTGMIFDTVSQELFPRVTVVPVMFSRRFLEWKPRLAGGGLVAVHTELPSDAVRGEKGFERPNGNLVNDTRQHYVLYNAGDGLWNMALLSLKSTGIKISQQWLTQMGRCREPILDKDGSAVIDTETGEPAFRRQHMYERQYELFTQLKTKNQDSWYTWSVKLLPKKTGGGVLREAVAFYKLLQSQKINLQETYSQDKEEVSDFYEVAY